METHIEHVERQTDNRFLNLIYLKFKDRKNRGPGLLLLHQKQR